MHGSWAASCIVTKVYFIAAGIITGDIKVEGHDKEQGPFARISGYVEQVLNISAQSS